MSFIKSLFQKKVAPINSNNEFWAWFVNNEKNFHKVVQQKGNIQKEFFDKLSPKLNELKDDFYFLTGMYDDTTVELVITAEGTIKNIVFVEELIVSAPELNGWKFTALKPALDIKNVNIEMAGLQFNRNNISFYANNLFEYPDEIDITIVHHDLNIKNRTAIINGCYIFLENYLGELNFATNIDNLSFLEKQEVNEVLIPIEKLKDFLRWREEEFIEKYDGVRRLASDNPYAILEAELENGNVLVAVINTDLMKWDAKASHPWIMNINIKYDKALNNGLPTNDTYSLLEKIENDILNYLKDEVGYLNIGRQSANGSREIYFACKDFRKPSKVLNDIVKKYASDISVDYTIYKDKYWQSLNRFVNNHL